MRILLFDMGSYTYRDIKEALQRAGHDVDDLYYHFKDRYCDEFFSERFRLQLRRKSYDVVMSINFFPIIAMVCHEAGIPYVSWSYDSPLDERLLNYFNYETDHIYLFDRSEVEKYNNLGFKNVYHLPLAVNVERVDLVVRNRSRAFDADISFVGSMYESVLNALLIPADEYVKGYVEGLFQSQIRIYGCNFLESSIPDSIIDSLNASYAGFGQTSTQITKRGLAYAIATQITHVERSFLIEELAENYDVHLYTTDVTDLSDKVNVHGPVKYFDQMSLVFASSRLNLCPTLKSIASGIPLRALDIMAAGGVLFSNFQVELAEYFTDGEDLIMYESLEDAFAKADYYLKDDNVLKQISSNGHDKIKKHFNYASRVDELLKVI